MQRKCAGLVPFLALVLVAGCAGGSSTDACTVKQCDDGNACTKDVCAPQGGCWHLALLDGTPCGTVACTNGTWRPEPICQSGSCAAQKWTTSCDDGNVCTTDVCDPVAGCASKENTVPCEDGTACTVGDACAKGACQPGAKLSCDDNSVCTTDSCASNYGCTHVSVVCDDQNPCTTDSCDAIAGCQYGPSSMPCSDGSACTVGDACANGACQPGAAVSCDDKDPGTIDSCDPAVGCVNMSQAVKIVAGWGHTCALTKVGGVWCWGSNHDGGLGIYGVDSYGDKAKPVQVTGMTAGAKAIAAGGGHVCAIDAAGSVLCWGLTQSTLFSGKPLPVPELKTGVKAIATGGPTSCAIDAEGAVRCWEYESEWGYTFGMTQILGLPDVVVAIAAGVEEACAIDGGGAVWCWANNAYDGGSNGLPFTSAVPVAGLTTGVQAIAVSGGHKCLIDAVGALKCWGANGYGQLGDGTTVDKTAPIQVPGLESGVKVVSMSGTTTCALLASGAVKCWGDNAYGQLGDGTTEDKHLPVSVLGIPSGVQDIAAGVGHTCALLSGGVIKCWGRHDSGQLGDGMDTLSPTQVAGLTSSVQGVAAGDGFSCAILSGGAVECWGKNDLGQLGGNSPLRASTPVPVAGLATGVKAIAAGGDEACAIDAAGGVQCWGCYDKGLLGSGTKSDKWTPVQVAGLTSGVKAIAVEGSYACAIDAGGALKCWGNNWYGSLGDGTTVDRPTPVQVMGMGSGVQAVTAGQDITCAAAAGGVVSCWGYNRFALGNMPGVQDIPIANPVPAVAMGLPAGIKAIAFPDSYTVAIDGAGALWSWLPMPPAKPGFGPMVVLASGSKAVAGGGDFLCLINSADELRCTGGNAWGELGNGTEADLAFGLPAGMDFGPKLANLKGVKAVATGESHACAIDTAGALKCWGRNANGEIGDGSAWSTTPVTVAGFGK